MNDDVILIAPYNMSITISQEVYKQLYPERNARFIPVLFRGALASAIVDKKIADYILANYPIIKAYNEEKQAEAIEQPEQAKMPEPTKPMAEHKLHISPIEEIVEEEETKVEVNNSGVMYNKQGVNNNDKRRSVKRHINQSR